MNSIVYTYITAILFEIHSWSFIIIIILNSGFNSGMKKVKGSEFQKMIEIKS